MIHMVTKENIFGHNKTFAYDLIRIYLGLGLFLKGIQFLMHPTIIMIMFHGYQMTAMPSGIITAIIITHIIGGLLIAIGGFTRLAAIVQLPFLFVATFMIHIKEGILSVQQNFEFAALLLFLAMIFAVFGSGDFSVDRLYKTKK